MDPNAIDLSTIDPRLIREMLVMNEVLRQHPPTNRAQGLARQHADLDLQSNYPGRYVAFVDVWTGDELERTVVTSAAEVGEFHGKLSELTPEVRRRVTTTRVPDPKEGIFAGGSGLV